MIDDKIKMMLPEIEPRTRNYSIRATEWLDFSNLVFQHIETYAVPQYRDKGEDECSEWEISDFITQLKKYPKRFKKNVREGQDKLDLMKIAHYACMLHAKLIEEENKAAALQDEVIFHHSV